MFEPPFLVPPNDNNNNNNNTNNYTDNTNNQFPLKKGLAEFTVRARAFLANGAAGPR